MQNLKQQQLFDRLLEKLPDHVTLLLVVLSGFLLARLTWTLFPADPALSEPIADTNNASVEVVKASTSPQQLGREIASYHLLGQYSAPKPTVKPAVQKQPAKPKPPPSKPRTPIKLVGLYALPDDEGLAMFDVKGQQQVVSIGEEVLGTHASLEKVYNDRVEVSWDGEIEIIKLPALENKGEGDVYTIGDAASRQGDLPKEYYQEASLTTESRREPGQMLPIEQDGDTRSNIANDARTSGTSSSGTSSGGARSGVTSTGSDRSDAEDSATPVASLGEFRQQIVADKTKLLEVLRPVPVSKNGQLTGYRITPGKNKALFEMTGLRAGDIVTQINGTDLNSNSSSVRAMQGLIDSGAANLTVLRGGQVTSVQIAF